MNRTWQGIIMTGMFAAFATGSGGTAVGVEAESGVLQSIPTEESPGTDANGVVEVCIAEESFTAEEREAMAQAVSAAGATDSDREFCNGVSRTCRRRCCGERDRQVYGLCMNQCYNREDPQHRCGALTSVTFAVFAMLMLGWGLSERRKQRGRLNGC